MTTLTKKEWNTLVALFRFYEVELRNSYGEPRDKKGTFRVRYAEADPIGAHLYEAAREVIERKT